MEKTSKIHHPDRNPGKPSFKEALSFWIRLGFISFGGPAGQIAIMHEFLVEKKRWISNSRFMHALNYTMLLPGPEAQQLATYTGWLLHGRWGGLAAGVFFVLPSMLILLILSMVYVSFGNIPWVYALFDGLKPAVIAIVLLALIKIGKKALQSIFHYVAAVGAFVAIFFFNVPFPVIILITIVTGIAVGKFFPLILQRQGKSEDSVRDDEEGYYISSRTAQKGNRFTTGKALKQVFVFFLLWATPLLIFYAVTSDFEFWRRLVLFFTQAAFVTFGGAYAVLPYVAQVTVEQYHWLTELQMIDGLALGETTPGPLVMVLTFVGFMAGYNHFGSSLTMGAVGLVTTTFYTFLPCFLFIFTGAPLIERTRDNRFIQSVLTIVTAAVVGVILNLTIYLGRAVLFPEGVTLSGIDIPDLIWLLVSVVALWRLKVGMITWIGISALYGLAIWFIL